MRPGRCVSADPAADFAAFDAFGFRSVLEAALAAFLLVTSFAPVLLRTCVRAEPAALFAALLAVGLRKVFEAADAARLPVTSVLRLVAIFLFPFFCMIADFMNRFRSNWFRPIDFCSLRVIFTRFLVVFELFWPIRLDLS